MKKEQFKKHIKRINKISSIISTVVGLTAAIFYFVLGKEFLEQQLYLCVTLLAMAFILIHLKANSLKQKAIIRYMTNSIGDNEF